MQYYYLTRQTKCLISDYAPCQLELTISNSNPQPNNHSLLSLNLYLDRDKLVRKISEKFDHSSTSSITQPRSMYYFNCPTGRQTTPQLIDQNVLPTGHHLSNQPNLLTESRQANVASVNESEKYDWWRFNSFKRIRSHLVRGSRQILSYRVLQRGGLSPRLNQRNSPENLAYSHMWSPWFIHGLRPRFSWSY